jgi:hypothetical protein
MSQDGEHGDSSPHVVLSDENPLIACLEQQILKSKQEVKELKEKLNKENHLTL